MSFSRTSSMSRQLYFITLNAKVFEAVYYVLGASIPWGAVTIKSTTLGKKWQSQGIILSPSPRRASTDANFRKTFHYFYWRKKT